MERVQTGTDAVDQITRSILILRGHRILLDIELATLDGVTTSRLNQQVRRNLARFPDDFMFQLTGAEYSDLMLQNAISSSGHGGRRKLPLAFTEHGAIMAATVLNSARAVEMGIYVVRAFVKLRELLASNREMAQRLEELEARIVRQFGTYDQAIAGMINTLRELMNPPQRPIGFTADLDRRS